MKRAYDSQIPPTTAQLQAARAEGVEVWGGYLASLPDMGISPWPASAFQMVQAAGMGAIAYCSGNDDPVAVAYLAKQLGVTPCLDDEDGIRHVGGWEEAWLARARLVLPFGLYGNAPVHEVNADFHILAAYPGYDPERTWPDTVVRRPPTPVGWQWKGTTPWNGMVVDCSWLDDPIAAVAPPATTAGGTILVMQEGNR